MTASIERAVYLLSNNPGRKHALEHSVCLARRAAMVSMKMVASESPKWPLSRIVSRLTVMPWA
jgi:hypothetical protein